MQLELTTLVFCLENALENDGVHITPLPSKKFQGSDTPSLSEFLGFSMGEVLYGYFLELHNAEMFTNCKKNATKIL